jgi:site-specific DNA recombinase
VIQALRAGEPDDDRELSAVRDQLATARTRHEELADAVATGTLSVALAAPSALRGLIEPGADVARRWNAAPMSTRRQVAKLLLTPVLIGELHITPCGSESRIPPEDRIHWHRE